ncbi:MAG: CoA ester lyase [Bacilli bacterium]
MRRSLLFIPGNNPAMLQNADVFDSDAIILDLEDAVHINEKDSARLLVSHYLHSKLHHDLEVIIRINGLDTPFYNEDLNAVVCDEIDTIMLPKAHVSDVLELGEMLTQMEKSRSLHNKINIIPIIELASSILEVNELAKMPRVDGILLGAEDLSTNVEIERTKTGSEILYPRSCVIYACKANKIDAIDTPFTDTKDDQGLILDCETAKSLGMNAKAAIHPNQIEIINTIFSPSNKNIEWAKRIIEAKKHAEENGLGVFSLDGKMVDKPIIERAINILKKAEKFQLL